MFLSPSTWEDLYGRQSNQHDRAADALPTHPPHFVSHLVGGCAAQKRRIHEDINIGGCANAGTLLNREPNCINEPDSASGRHPRRTAQLPRGGERSLFSSFSSFANPYTISSQPVRVFPLPPLPATAAVSSLGDAASSRVFHPSNSPVCSNDNGCTSPTTDVACQATAAQARTEARFYGMSGEDARPSYEQPYVATNTEYSSATRSKQNRDTSLRNTEYLLPAVCPGDLPTSNQVNSTTGGALHRPHMVPENYYNDNHDNQRSTAYARGGADPGFHEANNTYSKAFGAAAVPFLHHKNTVDVYAATPFDPHHNATPSPQCLSISDGARQLNVVRHRSAAAAASVFLFNSSGPSPSSTYRGSGAAAVPRSTAGQTAARQTRIGCPSNSCTPYRSVTDPLQHSALSSTTATSTSMTTATEGGIAQTELCCVAALIFNNAKEIGVALCELPSLTISLLQFADTAVFFKTTSLLYSRNPVEVLVPSTVVDTEFVQTLLRQHGAHMTFTSVQRCFYHTEAGVQRLSQLKSSEEAALWIEDTDRYLSIAAANALVLYMEHVNDMQLLPGSVRVRAETLEHFMEVSRTTARALQIVGDGNAAVGVLSCCAPSHTLTEDDPQLKGQHGKGRGVGVQPASWRRPRSTLAAATSTTAAVPRYFSVGAAEGSVTLRAEALADVIPRACTIMGQRYLRRALLQPLCDRVAVQCRHDTVEWLLFDPRRLHMLRALLRQTAALDLERLTATLTLQPRRERTEAQKRSYLESLLLLWSALPYLERLHTQLSAYLGLQLADADVRTTTALHISSPSSPLSTTTEDKLVKKQTQHQQQRSDGAFSKIKESAVRTASTPVCPSVLHSVATTLRQCRFAELTVLMGQYLERSVVPAVVELYERGGDEGAQLGKAKEPQLPLYARGQRAPAGGIAIDTSLRTGKRVPPKRAATSTLLRALRMCFLVQAPPASELDALRTRLSQRITGITAYAEELRQHFQLYSLRLEPDPVKLYCFSYLSSEESKTQAAPFTWRYAGGSHFALYLAALREHQEQQLAHGQLCYGEGGNEESEKEEFDGDLPLRKLSFVRPSSLFSSSSTTEGSLRTPGERQDNLAGLGALRPPPPLPSSWNGEPSTSRIQMSSEEGWHAATAVTAPYDSQRDGRHRRRRVRCGTEELEYRCAHTQECVSAILEQQMRRVQSLVQEIRQCFLSALQATVESLALLDTLLSFALYSLTHHCTRPTMVELKTGLTTTGKEAQTWETPLPNEGERKQKENSDGDDSPRFVDERTDCSSLFTDDASVSEWGTSSSTPSSQNLAYRPMTDDVVDVEKKRQGRHVPFFVKGAFHPSAGVAAQQPHYPNSFSASTAQQTQAQSRARDGLCLSWGPQGEVCIITGPNACGKTTLLRILGQHITLAQAGCFVPARQAQLFLADRLFAHMLCDELPSVLHSSFKRELIELNELTHAATEESVVLMDELGRSTTTAQGFSLAVATTLFLSNRHIHAVLTTHFAGLPSLARVRPSRVVALHFRVFLAQAGVGSGRERAQQQRRMEERDNEADCAPRRRVGGVRTITPVTTGPRVTIARFGHELFPGPCPQRWYGLAMAERMNFFEPVLALARHTRSCYLEVENGQARKRDAGCDGT